MQIHIDEELYMLKKRHCRYCFDTGFRLGDYKPRFRRLFTRLLPAFHTTNDAEFGEPMTDSHIIYHNFKVHMCESQIAAICKDYECFKL